MQSSEAATPAAAAWEQLLDNRPGAILPAGKDHQIRWLGWSKDAKFLRFAADSLYQEATIADEKVRRRLAEDNDGLFPGWDLACRRIGERDDFRLRDIHMAVARGLGRAHAP